MIQVEVTDRAADSLTLASVDDPLLSRPLQTELKMSVEDFDKYDVQGNPRVTIALKELRVSTIAQSFQLETVVLTS